MNIPPKYEDVVAECNALKEELVHMTALRDTWYAQYQELKSSRQQRLTVAEQRAGELEAAAQEMLRVAGIANQGSGAYTRAIINLNAALKPAEEGEGK